MNGIQRYVSNELTHFVGRSLEDDDARFDLLVKIIKGKQLTHMPYYPDPNVSSLNKVDFTQPFAEGSMVELKSLCFCDIPEQDLHIHRTKYGNIGLSFLKSFLVGGGASPVFYIANDSVLSKDKLMITDWEDAPGQTDVGNGKIQRSDYFDRMIYTVTTYISCSYLMVNRLAEARRTLRDTAGSGVKLPTVSPMLKDLDEALSRVVELLDDYSARPFSPHDETDPSEIRLDPGLWNSLKQSTEDLNRTLMQIDVFWQNHVLGYMKPYWASRQDHDSDNYYMEREWRMVEPLNFELADVRRVIFPASYSKRFREAFPEYYGQVSFVE